MERHHSTLYLWKYVTLHFIYGKMALFNLCMERRHFTLYLWKYNTLSLYFIYGKISLYTLFMERWHSLLYLWKDVILLKARISTFVHWCARHISSLCTHILDWNRELGRIVRFYTFSQPFCWRWGNNPKAWYNTKERRRTKDFLKNQKNNCCFSLNITYVNSMEFL